MNRKIGLLLFGESDLPVIAYKDAGMFLYAQYTYNFYNEIVAKFESEQRILHRQLTPYENQLLTWAREERDHAQHARNKDGLTTAIHGVGSIVGAVDEFRRC